MRILIEITHPAHVHFFRNAISIWREKGHEVFLTARDKDITIDLLGRYGLQYETLSRMYKRKSGLMLEFLIHEFGFLKVARNFKPDVIMSIAGILNVHASKLLKIPTIVFADTEHARLSNSLTFPFADTICTPSCYLGDLGEKQVRYEGYHELAYLHPNYFKPDPSVLEYLKVRKGEKFVIMRFVSWGASHDIGHKGLSVEMKIEAVKRLSQYTKIFITSEGELPRDLEPYRIKIPPEKIHDALYYSTLYFGDGGTMASESAVLGTPAVNVATSAALIGNFADMGKYGLMYVIPDEKKAMEKGLELLRNDDLKSEMKRRREKLISEKIDVTAFMVWFVDNYPESVKIIKETLGCQREFK